MLHSLAKSIKKNRTAYYLVAPVALYILAFQLYPVIETLRVSLTDMSLLSGSERGFIGLGNYRSLLFDTPVFWLAFRNHLLFVFSSLILQLVLGLSAAVALNRGSRWNSAARGATLIPWVAPIVVMGIIWRWIYDGQFGILNYILVQLGILEESVVWLGNANVVWPAIILTSVWKGFPYMTIMLLAGLQGIPDNLYEVASMDGATKPRKFVSITLPLLLPVMSIVSVASLIISWTKFDLIWVLTQGGPGQRTEILASYVYRLTFRFYEMGGGAAVATLSSLLMLVIFAGYLLIVRGRE